MQVRDVPLAEVRLDRGSQPRQQIDLSVVADYAADMDAGADFPPGEAVFDGEHYWLWDGWHRHHAERQRESATVRLNVRPGTVEDARWLALGANKAHGIRRTNEDKRRAVEAALRMRPGESNVKIAEHCGVDEKTVRLARERLEGTSEIPKSSVATGRDGRTISTANIGKRKEPSPPEASPEPPPPPLPFPAAAEEAEEPDEDVGEEPQPPPVPSPPTASGPKPARSRPPRDPEEVWVRLTHEVWSHVNGVRDLGGIQVLAADWTEKGRRSEALAYRQLGETFLGWADFLDGETSRE